MRGLKNKKALVTGGANGIGRACVEAFVNYNCSVVFSDIESEPGVELMNSLQQQGAKVYFMEGDMADEMFCDQLTSYATEQLGGINFLINNAFSFIAAGLQANRNQWQRSLEVGPMAFAKMMQLAAPIMQAEGGGAVVNISSISAHIAQPDRWTYNAAKGAVDQLTKCAALDLANKGIRVNSVSPAWTWTRETLNLAGGEREKYDALWGKFHMLGRCARADEIASACMFLCSEEASFITGTDLAVDGGFLALGSEGVTDSVDRSSQV